MSRKDYQRLADAFSNTRPTPEENSLNKAWGLQWRLDVEVIANTLKNDNPRFNRDKFYAACGLKD